MRPDNNLKASQRLDKAKVVFNVCLSFQEHFLTDALLREVVDRMGNDLAEAADAYLDFSDPGRMPVLGVRSHKDMEMEEQLFPVEYDSLGEPNPNPSIRDQEYLEHSTLWGKHRDVVRVMRARRK